MAEKELTIVEILGVAKSNFHTQEDEEVYIRFSYSPVGGGEHIEDVELDQLYKDWTSGEREFCPVSDKVQLSTLEVSLHSVDISLSEDVLSYQNFGDLMKALETLWFSKKTK